MSFCSHMFVMNFLSLQTAMKFEGFKSTKHRSGPTKNSSTVVQKKTTRTTVTTTFGGVSPEALGRLSNRKAPVSEGTRGFLTMIRRKAWRKSPNRSNLHQLVGDFGARCCGIRIGVLLSNNPFSFLGHPRNPNHRAPNHQLPVVD